MLTIRGVTKCYRGTVRALDDISVEIGRGIWGLLGPNGAGKTTLMRVLSTLLRPDAGEVWFDGIDVLGEPHRLRPRLGYLPQEYGFYPTFTAFQMLDYFATLKNIQPATARRAEVMGLLERVNLAHHARDRVGTFSTGMRQRLGVAQALLGKPDLLIVDEPTAGLDPEERLRLHNLLAEIGQNVVVVLSTHIVSDVSALCSRFAILRAGRIVADSNPGTAVDTLQQRVFQGTIPLEHAEQIRGECRVLSRLAAAPGYVQVKVYSHDGPPAGGFRPATATFDDFYLQAVGEAAGRA